FCIHLSIIIYGETFVNSGLAAIIFANMPVAVLIASVFFLNEKAKLMQIAGLTIAITAFTGILLEETNTSTEIHWQGITA
ncbi:EamA family transporter, partial [Salmonella enterica]|uniref:EamA family transporter n=1 Tax=Salmonella enterica TaxID=28901 RepID=UPI0020C50E05